MGSWEVLSNSVDQTIEIGRKLASELRPPVLILLAGELGAGKTTLAKGIIGGLGAAREEEVTSPTFTLVHTYSGSCKVYHVDLYRVDALADLETLGLDDVFAEPAVVLVEWPERLAFRPAWPTVEVEMQHVDLEVRRIRVAGVKGA